MAFGSVGTLGSQGSASAGTTVVITTTATAEVGNVIVVWTAWDNSATTDSDTTQLSVTDSAGNTYTRIRERNESSGAADDGVLGAFFYTVVTSQLSSGGTITVTNSSSETAKVAAAWEFTIGAGSTLAVEQTAVVNAASGQPGAISLSSMTSREYLLLTGIFMESNGATMSAQDSDYNTAHFAVSAAGGASAARVGIHSAFRIATLTDDTYDATLSTGAQHVQIMAALYEVPSEVDAAAEVSWAELEVPFANAQAELAWAEVEVPSVVADADAEVSWAEVEVPTANASAEVSWAEFEVPFAPAAAEVSWAEVEIPFASAAGEVAWAEVEVPFASAAAEVSWAELEVPFANASAEVSWAEVEVPTAPAGAELAWAEVETPLAPASAEISWAELEVPEVGAVVDDAPGRRSRRFRRWPFGG